MSRKITVVNLSKKRDLPQKRNSVEEYSAEYWARISGGYRTRQMTAEDMYRLGIY